MADPFEPLLARIPSRNSQGVRPAVTLSYAQSLDGSIATAERRPLQLSGKESLRVTHRLRSAHEAILVGIGTVLSDNPRLTVREIEGEQPQPVVLDTHLRLPLNCALLDHPRPPLIAASVLANRDRRAELEGSGARVLTLPTRADGWLDLPPVLERLGQLGIASLLVEGGARVITSFLQDRLADALVLTLSPTVVGGLRGVGQLSWPARQTSAQLVDPGWAPAGQDWILWGELAWPAD